MEGMETGIHCATKKRYKVPKWKYNICVLKDRIFPCVAYKLSKKQHSLNANCICASSLSYTVQNVSNWKEQRVLFYHTKREHLFTLECKNIITIKQTKAEIRSFEAGPC